MVCFVCFGVVSINIDANPIQCDSILWAKVENRSIALNFECLFFIWIQMELCLYVLAIEMENPVVRWLTPAETMVDSGTAIVALLQSCL